MKVLIKNSFLVLNSLLVSTLLVACAGDSSDPLEKYDNLNGVPPHSEESDKQVAYPNRPFIIEIEGGSSGTYGEFTEGKEGQAEIRVIENNIQGSDYIQTAKVEIQDFPSSETFTLTNKKEDASVYILKWKPSIGFTQARASRTLKLNILATAKNGIGTQATPVSLVVTKNGEIPTIKEIKGIDGITVTEGNTVDFRIDVKDPNFVPGAGEPKLVIYEYVNTDRAAFRDNASTKIIPNYDIKINPQSQNGGVFSFYRRMVLKDIATFRDRHNREVPEATSVDLCFLAAAKSVTGVESAPNQYCFTVNYLAQPAIITWASELPKQIPAGQEFKVNFKVGTQNSLSKVAINKLSTQIANLSGTKKLEKISTDDNDKEVEYALTWTPSCTKANAKKYPLKLKVDSSLNGKSLSTPLEYEIEVIPSEENCAVKPKGAKS